MLPLKAFRCEYEIAKHYEANPFEADWHIDLDEEEKQDEIWSQRLTEVVNKFFEDRPKLCAQIREDRLNNWVENHAVKYRKEVSQASLVSYLIKSALEGVDAEEAA
jgi:uncharacterized membrane-anchored protein YjiN (DUF445 family)